MRRVLLPLLAAGALLGLGGPAHAAPLGGLSVELSGEARCVGPRSDCGTDARGLPGPEVLVSSPDGRHVYAVSNARDYAGTLWAGIITTFAVDAQTGELAQLPGAAGCIGESDAAELDPTIDATTCALTAEGLGPVAGLAISEDGRWLYAVGTEASWLNRNPQALLATFRRDPDTGELTFTSCATGGAGPALEAGCVELPRLGTLAADVAAAPDGAVVATDDALTHVRIDTATGTPSGTGCAGRLDTVDPATGCVEIPGFAGPGPQPISVATDDRGGAVAVVNGSKLVSIGADDTGAWDREATDCVVRHAEHDTGCGTSSAFPSYEFGIGPQQVLISPDGTQVLVVSSRGQIGRLLRNPRTGTLRTPDGLERCLSNDGTPGDGQSWSAEEPVTCLTAGPLQVPASGDGATLSDDGFLYVSGVVDGTKRVITAFDTRDGALRAVSCAGYAASCDVTTDPFIRPGRPATVPDHGPGAAHLFFPESGNTGIGTLEREVAPTCVDPTEPVTVPPHTPTAVELDCTDPNPGQEVTLSVPGSPAVGRIALRDGAAIYTPQTAQAEQTDTITVRPLDDDGDPGPPVRVDLTLLPDLADPAVTLVNPTPGAPTSARRPTFAGVPGRAPGDERTVRVLVWQGTEPSGSALAELEAAVPDDRPYQVTADADLPDGRYVARAEQRDAAGRVGYSGPLAFTVDTTGPSPVSIDEPTPASGGLTPAIGGLAGTAEGDLPEVTVRVLRDGEVATERRAVVGTGGRWTALALELEPGTYEVHAAQADEAGNATMATPRTLHVAAAAPAPGPAPAADPVPAAAEAPGPPAAPTASGTPAVPGPTRPSAADRAATALGGDVAPARGFRLPDGVAAFRGGVPQLRGALVATRVVLVNDGIQPVVVQGQGVAGIAVARSARASGARRRPGVTVRRMTVAPGRAGEVRLTLTQATRRLLARRGRLTVRVTIQTRAGKDVTRSTRTFRLRAPKRRR